MNSGSRLAGAWGVFSSPVSGASKCPFRNISDLFGNDLKVQIGAKSEKGPREFYTAPPPRSVKFPPQEKVQNSKD